MTFFTRKFDELLELIEVEIKNEIAKKSKEELEEIDLESLRSSIIDSFKVKYLEVDFLNRTSTNFEDIPVSGKKFPEDFDVNRRGKSYKCVRVDWSYDLKGDDRLRLFTDRFNNKIPDKNSKIMIEDDKLIVHYQTFYSAPILPGEESFIKSKVEEIQNCLIEDVESANSEIDKLNEKLKEKAISLL
ncbi:MAG: hypothetical protein BM557_06070 [Flavobacterium sp. MedPE-SWcel]|uniref:hypothetical protein n=1 Tax=uncultured Flavobacterium sp. TaxID=165435 RepID=UPI000923A268|nr:hypothetical protein [uncultured Flavobacterium sp.]OIQ19267.1 MAG: hypothetical protein BM557_06070 [Flavobacterium sp. MedPE-SWcel]